MSRAGIRHDAQHGHARLFLQHRKARAKQLDVAAEFVDDRADDTRALLRLQQSHRAVKLREHAAPVDVPHKQYRRVHQLCQAHIDDVAVAAG